MGTTPPKSATVRPHPEETKEDPGEIPEPEPDTVAAIDESGSTPETGAAHAERSALRAGLITGGTALTACIGLALFGILHTGNDTDTAHPRIPTTPVTYQVTGTGTADLTYQARNTSGKATVIHAAHLPWHTTVNIPLGQDPVISIVLTQHGGQARCTLTIRGQHVQAATAYGKFGRATCQGELASPTPTESYAAQAASEAGQTREDW